MESIIYTIEDFLIDVFCSIVVTVFGILFSATDYIKVTYYLDLLNLSNLKCVKYENSAFMGDEDIYKVYLKENSKDLLIKQLENKNYWIRVDETNNNDRSLVPKYITNSNPNGYACLYDINNKEFVPEVIESINNTPYYYYLIDFDDNVLYFFHRF